MFGFQYSKSLILFIFQANVDGQLLIVPPTNELPTEFGALNGQLESSFEQVRFVFSFSSNEEQIMQSILSIFFCLDGPKQFRRACRALKCLKKKHSSKLMTINTNLNITKFHFSILYEKSSLNQKFIPYNLSMTFDTSKFL